VSSVGAQGWLTPCESTAPLLLYDWWRLVDERRRISRILEAPVLIRYDADAAGGGEGTTPRNMMNSPTLSGVSNPTT
jgi:hypothetical protein